MWEYFQVDKVVEVEVVAVVATGSGMIESKDKSANLNRSQLS